MRASMVRSLRVIVWAVLGAMVLMACGGDDDVVDATGIGDDSGDTGGDDESDTATPAGSPDDLIYPATNSTFTIDGTDLSVDFLVRCVPFSASGEPPEGEVDLVVRADDGTTLHLGFIPADESALDSLGDDVPPEVAEQFADDTRVSFDSGLTQDRFGARFIGGETEIHSSEVDTDRWTGSVTITDDEASQVVDVAWDLELPPEEHDCSQ